MDHQRSEPRSVSFHNFVTVVECLHVREYSRKEFRSTWYSLAEMAAIQEDCHSGINQEKMCPRGLECRTPSGSRKRRHNKASGWFAVADEQIRQWHEKIYDPQALADEYMKATRNCLEDALEVGASDRQAVIEQEKPLEQPKQNEDSRIPTKRINMYTTNVHTKPCSLVLPQSFGPLSPAA